MWLGVRFSLDRYWKYLRRLAADGFFVSRRTKTEEVRDKRHDMQLSNFRRNMKSRIWRYLRINGTFAGQFGLCRVHSQVTCHVASYRCEDSVLIGFLDEGIYMAQPDVMSTLIARTTFARSSCRFMSQSSHPAYVTRPLTISWLRWVLSCFNQITMTM